MFERWWVRIPVLYTGWTTLEKEAGVGPFKNSTLRSLVPVLNAVVCAIGRQDELRPGVVATVSLDGRCARDLRTTPAAKTKRNSSTCH